MRHSSSLAVAALVSCVAAQRSAAQTAPAAIEGTVYDSIARAPLAGAVVQLVAQGNATLMLSTTADSLGHFRMPGARPGRYIAGVIHPTLDMLGLDASMRVIEVSSDTLQHLDLALRDDARMRAQVCGSGVSDSVGVLVGQVRDANSGEPINDARIVVTWQELVIGQGTAKIESRRVPASVRPGGYFAICGVPGDDEVIATPEVGERHGGGLHVRVPAGHVVRRDFTLGTADATATLTGFVKRPDGKGAGGAVVLVPGTDVRTTTNDDGRFALDGLPSGTYTVEARAIGFTPGTAVASLTARRGSVADVTLGARVASLETYRVLGKGSRALRAQEGFLHRMRNGGSGRFVTAEQISHMNATETTDVLSRVPGIFIFARGVPPASRNGPDRQVFMRAPIGRGYCKPAVYIDGTLIFEGGTDIDFLTSPERVVGFEVYRSALTAPPEFSPTSTMQCGVILAWSKP